MAKRQIMRIELSGAAKKAMESLTERLGMTHLSMNSRLIEWFERQDDGVRMQLMDKQADSRQTTRLALERMTK